MRTEDRESFAFSCDGKAPVKRDELKRGGTSAGGNQCGPKLQRIGRAQWMGRDHALGMFADRFDHGDLGPYTPSLHQVSAGGGETAGQIGIITPASLYRGDQLDPC
mgnify:CR=1 FL=1